MRKIRSFVSRKKRLTNLQQRSLDAHAGDYCISFDESGRRAVKEYLTPGNAYLEIGFGMGEVTARIAREHPENRYLGIEVFQPGIGRLLHEISEEGLENIRIIAHDVDEVIDCLIPEETLDGIHIFFPDPWPKKRHHKRRLFQEPFVRRLLRVLSAGGYIYAVTDWEDYARQMLEVCNSIGELDNPSRGFSAPLAWRPRSKFESKGLAKNHVIREIYCIKK